jgi:DNA modification methylase
MTHSLLINANALRIPLAASSVHCCVTSPPYFSLRNYGVAGQIGLERDVTEFVDKLVQVFREVKRVLRDDGTLWLNLGDSYNGSGGAGGDYNEGGLKAGQPRYPGHDVAGLKPKDLIGVPWRVAFALQEDGWILRSDCIWAKPNPMPESVTDRPTKSHEYMFLLAKRERYYYDADAIREEHTALDRPPGNNSRIYVDRDAAHGHERKRPSLDNSFHPAGRNRRTVWTIATAPYSGAHFATYPPALVEPCIKAGTSERGVCPACGAPWRRVVERGELVIPPNRKGSSMGSKYTGDDQSGWTNDNYRPGAKYKREERGWSPTCTCDAGDPIPATVLDCFNGAGTTGLVAQQLGRRYVGLDLSPEYLRLSRDRLGMTALDAWTNGKPAAAADLGPLFAGGAEA